MAGIVAGSVRAGEVIAGRVTAGQQSLGTGTIYETPLYQKADAPAVSYTSAGNASPATFVSTLSEASTLTQTNNGTPVVSGSVRAGESVAGRVFAGQQMLNSGTIYQTPTYNKMAAQVDLSSLSVIAVGDADAVIGASEATVGAETDQYTYVSASDWTAPVSYTKAG